ncbi:hypothetical protein N7474_002308 [Penicillium riverlandense]|uniref:uncharacterized protein n=1 Tax=Penicillium riverlandense TaxID=1903569 RepID=UPI0025499F14|nr:uncharacterized protein N7474_002308 [Penicillium riverlandense]KAJ5825170.1 hypothetical protein N7474_002308 [Penicillium riverlandense]
MPALDSIRVLELAGLAPGPFAGLLLAENGADVLRVDRVEPGPTPSPDVLVRGKSSICVDLKSDEGQQLFLRLIPHVDVVIDPFRPGVLEKLGLDPTRVLLQQNPKLIVARLTGFRRDGKYSSMAGHDLNYLAVSGVLSILGPSIRLPPLNRPLPPSPPGNILGDFAGGGLVCFVGILLALISRTKTGKGQIVEANMVDVGPTPGENLVDGGCPYYNVYECKDEGKYMAVASLEPKFFEALSHGLRLCDKDWGGSREDRKNWPMIKILFEKAFRTKTRKEWEAIFDGTDACCTPVLRHEELELNNYEQRPLVSLKNTPSLMPDNGWAVKTLSPGIGGEDLLRKWAGWKENKDFVTVNGGLYNKEAAKM